MRVGILENIATFEGISVVILLCITATFVLIWLIQRLPEGSRPIAPLIASMFVNLAFISYRLVSEPNLVADEMTWHKQGLLVADYLQGMTQQIDGLNPGKEGYPWLLGVLYWVAGEAPFIPLIVGSLMAIILVPMLGVIASIVATDLGLSQRITTDGARWAMYFMALCPTITFWAPRLLRETLSMLLIGLALLSFLSFLSRKKVSSLIVMVLVLAALTSIRGQIGVGMGAGLVVSGAVIWSLRVRFWIARVFLFAPAFVAVFAATWWYVDSTSDLSVNNTAYRNEALNDASSAFQGDDVQSGTSSYADVVGLNLPRVVFGPFPNEMTFTPVMLLAAVSTLFWFICFYGAFMLYKNRKAVVAITLDEERSLNSWRSVLVLLTIVLTFIAILSITSGNYGLVIRLRLMPFVALIPLAGVGFALMNAVSSKYKCETRPFGTRSGRLRVSRAE